MPPSRRYSPLRPRLTRSRWRSFASARSKPWPIKAHADGIPVSLSPWRRSTYNPPGVAWTEAVLRIHPPSREPALVRRFLFDFVLTVDDIAAIAAMDTGVRGGPDPAVVDATAFSITSEDEASTGDSLITA